MRQLIKTGAKKMEKQAKGKIMTRFSYFCPLIFMLGLYITNSQMTFAQTLPVKVKSYLNKNYSGWKLSSTAQYCNSEYKNSNVAGDFNSDGKTDYAVKFNKGRKGYILAFVSNGSEYKPHILESNTSEGLKSQGLGIARKGDSYLEIDGDIQDKAYRQLRADAPIGGTCESSKYHYIYRNGKFRNAFTSD